MMMSKKNQNPYLLKLYKIKLIIKTILSLNLSSLLIFILTVSSLFICIGASASFMSSSNSGFINGSMSGVPQEFVQYFNEASEIYKIPNWTLAAISKQESEFNPSCSYGGAYGIMQVQKYDSASGKDLWAYLMNSGLGKIYTDSGYSFSSTEDMWNTYLHDPRAQIIGGSYEIRYYINYVLYRQGKTKKLDYNSTENMSLINWTSDVTDQEFKDTLRRVFACYNGGPRYGMNVDLDKARFNYPNKVFNYAMEFRDTNLTGNIATGDNSVIEKAIATGSQLVGKSPYVWGGGRCPSDITNRRFDCSSFVHWCYANAGVTLGDYRSVVTDNLALLGKKVSPNEMVRGDIIFFNTYKYNGHVAIYLGSGKFLHCGTSKGVWINDINESYWKKVFNGNIRRVA